MSTASPAAARPHLRDVAKRHYTDNRTLKPDHYFRIYDNHFSYRRDEPLKILEIGVWDGASLLVWRDYFPNATIVGLDIRDAPKALTTPIAKGEVTFVQGDQSKDETLDRALAAAPGGFDVIIDDGSHIGALSRASFEHLFHKALKPHGLYFVEDYGTGYMDGYFDGSLPKRQGYKPEDKVFPSHADGMVGWLKQLVDEMHGQAVFPGGKGLPPIESITFWPSIALVKKI